MRWVIIAVLLGSLAAPAFGQEDIPVSVIKRPIGDGGDMWTVIVTSRADRLDIRGIDFNRGACRSFLLNRADFPHPMRFGEQVAMTMQNCDPIEVKIQSDQGTAVIEMPE